MPPFYIIMLYYWWPPHSPETIVAAVAVHRLQVILHLKAGILNSIICDILVISQFVSWWSSF